MKQRILTACVGVPFLIFTLVIRDWFAEIVIAVLAFIALRECYRALRAAGYEVCTWGGYAAVMVMWPFARLKGVLDPLLLVTMAMGISMTGVLLSKKPTFRNAAASIYPLFTALLPMAMFMMMINGIFGRVPGVALVTMAFAIAFVGDAAAYFGGRALGKRKLCPTISPKKTVEGAVCYLVGGVIAALICRAAFVYAFHMPMPGIVLGLIGALAGQIGDLSASLLKRAADIKDYGSIFPGHGGVMDRFDSAIFTLIVCYGYTLVLTL